MTTEHSSTELCMRFLWERANVVLLDLSSMGVIRRTNVFAESFFGMQLPGCSMHEIVIDFDAAASPDRWWHPSEAIRLVNVTTASGIPQTLYSTVWPLVDGVLWFGQVDANEQERLRKEFLTLNRELNQLSRELELTNAELARLNALKNQFLGMAAHDLRAPVGVILNYANFLQETAGPHLQTAQIRYLEQILTSAEHMGRLIDDFLDVSMIEADHFPIEIMPIDVQTLFDDVRRLVEIAAAKRLITLVMEVDTDMPVWHADGPKLEQVLANLISNAIEFSPLGTQVVVGCRLQGTDLEFCVTDHGSGLTDAQKKTLFQAFSGPGRRKSDGQRSIGLGLIIAHKIVHAHGGHFKVESSPGHGATFTFTVPAHAPEE